jgi:hypothetical protein
LSCLLVKRRIRRKNFDIRTDETGFAQGHAAPDSFLEGQTGRVENENTGSID